MTPEEAAAATAGPIVGIGGGFMIARPTLKKGPALGFPKGWAFYFSGRGGVLGDVVPEVIAAAFMYFPLERVRTEWRAGREVMEPRAAAAAYAEACQDWGREHLGDVEDTGRLATLLQRVVDAADPAGAPVFAGWRTMPLPGDGPGAVAQLLQVLREFRGGMHGAAVLAAGLTPLEAVVAGGGEGNAEFFGWERPYPDAEPLRDRHRQALATTDRLAARPYAALDEAERRELVERLNALQDAVA